jgi:calcineurin-like phosphoesterase family protein
MSHDGPMRWWVGGIIGVLLLAGCLGALRAPAAMASAPTLVAAGDIACPPGSAPTGDACEQAGTATLVQSLGPTAVAALGDEQYESGTSAEFAGSFEPSWGQFKSLIHPAVGNHEYLTSGASGYFGYFGGAAGDPTKGYYSFELGDWHLIALNSNCEYVSCAAGASQEQWLRADLASHSSRCTLAYWHHPLFTSGPSKGQADNLATRPLWQALYDNHADVVLNGHDHDYERFAPQAPDGQRDPNGIREFVVGTGGKSHFAISTTSPNSEAQNADVFGVLLLGLDSASYNWRFVPQNPGGFTDQGAATCHRSTQPFTTGPRPDPVLSRLSMLHRRFRVGRNATPLSARRRAVRGSAFRYRLSEAATVTIRLYRRVRGRRVGRRCRADSRRYRNRRRCTRSVRKGTLTRSAHLGQNTVRFSGRIGRRALKPGRYQAKLQAVTVGALHPSRARSVSFTVLSG